MVREGEERGGRWGLRFRRMRSRIRVRFILAGYLGQWATPLTLAIGGGVLLLARVLQVWAYGHLDKASRTSGHRPPAVTSSGPYAHVRNPIMFGSAFSDVGFLVMTGNPFLLGAYIIIMGPVHVLRILRVEEPFLRKRYGEAFDAYASSVPRFIPRILPAADRERRRFRLRRALGNKELSRTFNYLFLGSGLVLWSHLGEHPYLPSWEGLRDAASRPWAVGLAGALGALALLASYLQRGVDRAEGAREPDEVRDETM